MKLRRLIVHNYKSIKDVKIEVPDMLVLLGPNNHGKSNLLSALEFGLSSSAKIDADDFFSFRAASDSSLWVEMTFAQLTEQEKSTFRKYVRADETLCIRKTASLDVNGAVGVAYNGYVQEPQQWWLQGGAIARLGTREQIQTEVQQVPELGALLATAGRITRQQVDEFQQQYIAANRAGLMFTQALEEAPLLGQKNVAGGVLPDFFLMPAVRDLSDETKIKATTAFGRLLQRAVRDMAERDQRFVELRGHLQALVDELNSRPDAPPEDLSELARLEASIASELTSWGVSVSIEVSPPEIEKVFELGTQLHLDDGLKTLAERKGHGLQRAVLFALLRSWAKALRSGQNGEAGRGRQSSESAFFAMEEPELFLHPHAQRQLFASLAEISGAAGHQVFICTHSTHFVDLEFYGRIVLVSKESAQGGTTIRQCTDELFEGEDAASRKHRFHLASWVNPDRGELFFARKVVLSEGETEKVLLPFLAKKLGCFDVSVSVIDCASKHNIPLYIAVLNAFGVPYCVVHDEDPLPDPIPPEWPAEKARGKRQTFEMNRTIANAVDGEFGIVEMLSPDIEGAGEIPRSQAEKKGKALAALDHFDQKLAAEIPPRLAEVVRSAYRLQSLGRL